MVVEQIRSYLKRIIGLLVIISMIACRKELPQINAPEDYDSQSYVKVFDAYWTGMNHNYVFWDIDPTNWDTIYHKYRPLFAQLRMAQNEDAKQAATYFKEISSKLVDGHYKIYFSSSTTISDIVIDPSYQQLKLRSNYHERIPDSYFSGTLMKSYLDPGAAYAISGDDEMFIVTGSIEKNIGYFHSDACDMSTYYYSEDRKDRQIKKQISTFLEMIKNPQLKGLILDLRSNYGGNANEVNFILGRMTEKAYKYGFIRTKSGLGRRDFGPWIAEGVTPLKDAKALEIPIVILTDMWSMSCAEHISAAAKLIPNGKITVIGERTFGATSPLTDFTIYNAGQFYTGFLDQVSIASCAFRYIDGQNYEGIGFSPDIPINVDLIALAAGRDAQLEKAINIIRQ
ncbi:MAG: hypothetical protein EOO89_13780 [Pedobacter sp.]|nr:MAG: hypothetical protein EOO89_13780 [Pedobacter sp.]